MRILLFDLRHAFRLLVRSPGFAGVAVITLALGIGANTAIFSLINGLLIHPLDFGNPDELVILWEHNRPRNNPTNIVSTASFLAWQERNDVFEHMALYSGNSFILTGRGTPERHLGARVSAEWFSTLGINAIKGRTFLADEFTPGHDNVVMISETLWRDRFGSDPDLVGRTLIFDGVQHTVVGILPSPNQIFPTRHVWLPWVFTPEHRTHHGKQLLVLARLGDGISREQAQTRMDAIAEQLEQEDPDHKSGWGVNVMDLKEALTGDVRPMLFLLAGSVGFVLLIACANVANLLLARGTAREREMAIRSAIGAGRSRLIRQLLTESLLLALLGGASGLLVGQYILDTLILLIPGDISSFNTGTDAMVLGFTFLTTLMTALFFGLIPAIKASGSRYSERLRDGSHGSPGSGDSARLRGLLVVTEIALALIMLVGSVLLIRSFHRLSTMDPGFDPDTLVSMIINLPTSIYSEDHQRVQFFEKALEQIESLPSVISAGAISKLPIESGVGASTSFALTDRPAPPPGDELVANVRLVSGDYFHTMGIPLLSGRLFGASETPGSPRSVLINQKMAEHLWPGQDPLGQVVRMDWSEVEAGRIVGVVGDVLHRGLDSPPDFTLYWAHSQLTEGGMYVVVRSEADTETLVTAIRSEIETLDPALPVYRVQTMAQVLSDELNDERLMAQLLTMLALVGMLLAAMGVYGVVSFTVRQRTQEIGIRMAVGASQGRILGMIFRQGLVLALVGVVAGVAGSMALTRVIESFLFETSPIDPLTLSVTPALILIVVLAACYLPARRATRIEPISALRSE